MAQTTDPKTGPARLDQPRGTRLSPQMLGSRAARSRLCDDFHETPGVAVEALLSVDQFHGLILEPACGLGAISAVLIEHGHDVISTDLVDRGYGQAPIDFLLEWEPRAPNIITNPPYKLALEFAQHALALTTGKVALLVRWQWLASERRRVFFQNSPLARVWLFSKRLPLMHRHGYDGPRASSAIDHCWCVWEHGHVGPGTTIGWLPEARR